MKKLKLTTNPKKLTLRQMWKFHMRDSGVEDTDFMISSLDIFYPNLSREDVEIPTKIRKYEQALSKYKNFSSIIKGMG